MPRNENGARAFGSGTAGVLPVLSPSSVRARRPHPICAINQTNTRPEIVAAWDRQGATPMTKTPAELDAFLRQDIEKWAQVAKFSGAIGH